MASRYHQKKKKRKKYQKNSFRRGGALQQTRAPAAMLRSFASVCALRASELAISCCKNKQKGKAPGTGTREAVSSAHQKKIDPPPPRRGRFQQEHEAHSQPALRIRLKATAWRRALCARGVIPDIARLSASPVGPLVTSMTGCRVVPSASSHKR